MKRLLLLLSLLSLSLVAHLSAQEQYKVTYSAGEGGLSKLLTMPSLQRCPSQVVRWFPRMLRSI